MLGYRGTSVLLTFLLTEIWKLSIEYIHNIDRYVTSIKLQIKTMIEKLAAVLEQIFVNREPLDWLVAY